MYIEYNGGKGAFGEFLQFAKENRLAVTNIQVSEKEFYCKDKEKHRCTSYIVTVSSDVKRTHAEMTSILASARGVQYIEEL